MHLRQPLRKAPKLAPEADVTAVFPCGFSIKNRRKPKARFSSLPPGNLLDTTDLPSLIGPDRMLVLDHWKEVGISQTLPINLDHFVHGRSAALLENRNQQRKERDQYPGAQKYHLDINAKSHRPRAGQLFRCPPITKCAGHRGALSPKPCQYFS